jgi:YjbE family integral membrane protein
MNGAVTVGMEVGRIVWINILLSGDNAVVIALACRSLKGRQKVAGIVLGALLAVLLRIGFTGVVTTVLNIPYVKIVGGLVLLWIAVKLILHDDEAEVHNVEGGATLRRAVATVVVADIVMSLDNVLAIAAAAHNDMALIVFGLALSVPLVIAGSSLISAVMSRFPVLAWTGAALLGWISGEMVFTDPVLRSFAPTEIVRALWALAAAILVIVIGWFLAMRRTAIAEARERHARPPSPGLD